MSQVWTIPPPGNNAQSVILETNIPDALNALRSLFSGPSEPGATVPYQLWADTTADQLKMRNGADSAWIILGPLALVATKTISLYLPLFTLGGPVNVNMFGAERAYYFNRIGLVSDTTTVSNPISDYWTVQIRNVTAALDLRSVAYQTDMDGEFIANWVNWIPLDQNQLLAADDVLQFQFGQVGVGAVPIGEAILQCEVEER